MLLHDLLRQSDLDIAPAAVPNLEISGVFDDSRTVRPGGLFVARQGLNTDGNRHVADAHARGAVAVVTQTAPTDAPLPHIVVPDAAAAASALAHAFAGHPSRRLNVIGITGTNGKTTTAYLLRHLLSGMGRRCGMIGTVEINDGRRTAPATMTTPGPAQLSGLMADMLANGCGACAIEISSHALDQQRVAGVRFAAAAFTNLTGDHLDYHLSMERYAAAKARLFAALAGDAVAAINGADPWSGRMTERCRARIVRYGFAQEFDYVARDLAITAQGTHFVLVTPDGQTPVHMRLIGRHNVENALAAAAIAGEAFGLSVHQIAARLADAPGAPGRLQPVSLGQSFAVLVDYAHTDDALQNVLTALRPLTRGRLRVLFGCGGDRDRPKRPRMARVATALADAVYLTSDNPRSEDPQAILRDILAGVPAGHDKRLVVEPDRRSAIERILADARSGDVVLIAGKGHENYQILGSQTRHFDDVEEVARVLGAAGVSTAIAP